MHVSSRGGEELVVVVDSHRGGEAAGLSILFHSTPPNEEYKEVGSQSFFTAEILR